MQKLLAKLARDYPNIHFVPSKLLCWSATGNEISYGSMAEGQISAAGLLHEVGHARLNHTGYASDLELLRKEVDAWQEALRLADTYNIVISKDHIEDCIDTYREWVYKRSLCPRCQACGLQHSETGYNCLNCLVSWKVTASRHCRPYRLQHTHTQKSEI